MLHGGTAGRLKLDDFPNEKVDPSNLPEVELQTYVWDNLPGEQWLHKDEETNRTYIRERWRWDAVDKDPVRQGHRAKDQDWDDKVPWGAPNVANSRRPYPHRVDAFASPEQQGEEIVKILRDILVERARQSTGEDTPAIDQITDQIRELQKKIVEQSKTDIEGMEKSLSEHIGEIFVGFKVSLDARTQEVGEKSINIFSALPVIRMGPDKGHMAPLDKQGSGARRTLLWSALKIAADRPQPAKKSKAKAAETKPDSEKFTRPHVLLLDEPEICLHPAAIRDACRVLYNLASQGSGWQVMVTTHSPAFIDIARDNTTIVRVERLDDGTISGTTVFRPDRVKLTEDDKAYLKLLNQWDSYVAEFFFGGRIIVVEGDTEYSAFRVVIEADRARYRNVHIIRARGKFIIPTLIKIMNHFGSPYAVLHDSDTPKTKKGAANPAWAANEQIGAAVAAAPAKERVRLAASVVDFEDAMFGEASKSDKPYRAFLRMRDDAKAKSRVAKLLDYLLHIDSKLPDGIVAWATVAELEAVVAPKVAGPTTPA